MFRVKLQGVLGTGLDAQRLTFTEVTLQGLFDVLMKKHGTEGAAGQTLVAGYALFRIKLDNAVLLVNSVGRTSLTTLGNTALFTHDRHTDNGMGIKNHDPYPAFLGVVNTLAPHTAGQLADLAAGTPFRNYCQMHRFLHTGFHKGVLLIRNFSI
jgi:hypothetical protein